ncbi:hypothetical protein [Pantoea vagans]|uniref:hypothetical protein n=1 Tax=Pantoea vagans TaxID=470934 RepID=UPI0023B0A52E|nr:hypothetical protein [Pantoea vagans]MDE8558931.1 hypothetical protein [Pantoea vagans]MDE8578936.1 hypothetical protein [Pantoea vagans]
MISTWKRQTDCFNILNVLEENSRAGFADFMDIKVSAYPADRNPFRYLVEVDKGNSLRADYIVEFKGGTGLVPYLDCYYTEAELSECTLMVDFFDLQALYDISGVQKFEQLTDMHYTTDELEKFFIEGIAVAIFDVVERTGATIVFSAPFKDSLARYYHRLLKKYAPDVNYVYREDIREEVNFYVLETDKR